MKIWESIEKLSQEGSQKAVTLGNFDGVHVGHQKLVSELKKAAKEQNLSSVAILFDPHPAVVLGYPSPSLLTTPRQRAELLGGEGVDHVVIQPFGKAFAQVGAKEFLARYFQGLLSARVALIGPTTHLGRGREGTPEKIQEIAKEIGLELKVVEAVEEEGAVVNSSRIRNLIEKGEVKFASSLLGRPHFTRGRIVRGAGRGKSIGFATANLEKVETLLPARGVYATRIIIDGRGYLGATNIGMRPTVSDEKDIHVETHVIDFKGDLLGVGVELRWIRRIRDEKTFSSVGELMDQIQRDVAEAQKSRAVMK